MGSRVWGQLPPLAASSMSSLEGSNSIPNGFLTIHGGGGGLGKWLESLGELENKLRNTIGTLWEAARRLWGPFLEAWRAFGPAFGSSGKLLEGYTSSLTALYLITPASLGLTSQFFAIQLWRLQCFAQNLLGELAWGLSYIWLS